MKMSQIYSTNFRASDLPSPLRLTIAAVALKTFEDDGRSVEKPTILFSDHDNVLVVNRTVAGDLTQMFGSDETEDWIGQTVVLYNDPNVMFNNRKVGGVRVRAVESEAAE